MKKKMMAQRLYGPKDLRWVEIAVPQINKNDVLIKVKYCGVCGTDYAIYSGESSFWNEGLIKTPMTLGHEYCGIVEAVGSQVTSFKKGDRVVSDMAVSCGKCETCLHGNYMACKDIKCVGTIKSHDGAYAEYAVMPERHVFSIPDSMSFKQGALVEPAATGLNAVKSADIKFGDTVVIIGTGPIGLSAIPFAQMSGAKQIILAGRKDFKLQLGKKLGADILINSTKEDFYSRIMEITGGCGADVIIEASGSIHMFKQSIRTAGYSCRISLVAFYEKLIKDFDPDNIITREIRLIPVLGSPNLMQTVIQMIGSGKLDLTHMITEILPLKDAEHALNKLKDSSSSRIKILLEI